MARTPFIITVDTEGDNLWAKPREITTRNAAYLPRFQALCDEFNFKPVYLTNYEMAMCDEFVKFARAVIARDGGEVGMHLHAWNSPPLVPLTGDDFAHQPYLIEYPDAVMREKIRTITRLLEERFDRPMISHRAGRFAFDRRYAAMLVAEGYGVDCS
ncbi:MAG: deacetylase, partial [Steroidobacterales bacterium]